MSIGTVGRQAAAVWGITAEAQRLVQPAVGALPWSSACAVGALAEDSVALASLAITLVGADRQGIDPAPVRVDRTRIAASFGSERVLRIDGEAPAVWAPLSGFWRAGDGWVRTHANYPHHARALRALLGLADEADADAFAAAVATRRVAELEDRAAEVGAIVGAVRSETQWRDHPQGRIIRATPLIEAATLADAPPRVWAGAAAPLSGVRVLDLTRVIAGPVAARDLALAGAEVLRVDSPALEETGWIHLDTGQGKRSTLLDLGEREDRAAWERLLSSADVVLTGYRPGALTRFGLDPQELAQRHPGLVTASVSAWGTSGAWAGRRGFDSIVQAVSGIAMAESADGVTPGALPVQALDHSTGHLLAAAIVLALRDQRRQGGSRDVRMSLARTAAALLASDDPRPVGESVQLPVRERRLSGDGASVLTYAPPVLAFAGAPDDYARVGGRWGADEPTWEGE